MDKVTESFSRASILVEQYSVMKGEPMFDCLESVVIDLIADLLHLANMEELDVNSICKMAVIHVSAETASGFQGGA